MKTAVKNFERINITLPSETIYTVSKLAKKGGRSRFIDEALRFYIKKIGQNNLRKNLREGAIKRASRDINLTEEWFRLENEL